MPAPCRGTCCAETGRASRSAQAMRAGSLASVRARRAPPAPRWRESGGGLPRQKVPTSGTTVCAAGRARAIPAHRTRNRAPRRSLEESVAEPEVGEGNQHRRIEISAQDKHQDGGEHAQSERRQELFPVSHGRSPCDAPPILAHGRRWAGSVLESADRPAYELIDDFVACPYQGAHA